MNILDGSHDYQQSIHNLPQYYYHRNVTPDGENRHYCQSIPLPMSCYINHDENKIGNVEISAEKAITLLKFFMVSSCSS